MEPDGALREVAWRVGALRAGAEDVAWVSGGGAPDWGSARAATIAAVRELVAAEGRQEYRLQIADVEGIVNPGLGPDGELLLGDLERLIPTTRLLG